MATGGNGGSGISSASGGLASATATSTAMQGGTANATATAAGGNAGGNKPGIAGAANASSFATTINGNTAKRSPLAAAQAGRHRHSSNRGHQPRRWPRRGTGRRTRKGRPSNLAFQPHQLQGRAFRLLMDLVSVPQRLR